MILYNVTILIAEAKEQEFLNWLKNGHIQEVLATGLFVKAVLMKLLTEVDEQAGVTYAIQYYCENHEKLQEYYTHHAPRLREEGMQKFGENMLGFRTELEVLQEFTA